MKKHECLSAVLLPLSNTNSDTLLKELLAALLTTLHTLNGHLAQGLLPKWLDGKLGSKLLSNLHTSLTNNGRLLTLPLLGNNLRLGLLLTLLLLCGPATDLRQNLTLLRALLLGRSEEDLKRLGLGRSDLLQLLSDLEAKLDRLTPNQLEELTLTLQPVLRDLDCLLLRAA